MFTFSKSQKGNNNNNKNPINLNPTNLNPININPTEILSLKLEKLIENRDKKITEIANSRFEFIKSSLNNILQIHQEVNHLG